MDENEKVDILSAIEEKAESDRLSAIKAAEDYAAKRGEEAKKLAEDLAAENEAEINAIVDDIAKKNEVAVRMEKNRINLAAKQKAVGRIYDMLLEKLRGASGEDFLRLVSACVKKYGEKGFKLLISENAPVKAEDAAALPEVKKLGIKAETSATLPDGFVLSGEAYDRDFTFASIVGSVRESTEKDFSVRLLGDKL